MSRTVLAEVDGFTPIIDSIVEECGLITAVVFGIAWRYCQMSDGVCRASQENIAVRAGLTRKAVNEHLQELVSGNYLEVVEKEPGKPLVYRDTGKAGLSLKVTGGVTESYRGCNPGLQVPVTLGYTKKVFKKDLKKENKDSNLSTETEYEPFNNEADLPQSFVDEYKPKKVSDVRFQHVAYSAFYSITKRKPNKAIIDYVIESIGDKPDISKLKECYTEWVARGYNPQAYKWLEWYQSGIPERTGKKNGSSDYKLVSPDVDYYDLINH